MRSRDALQGPWRAARTFGETVAGLALAGLFILVLCAAYVR